jgi:hypothetical protein
MRWGAQPTDMDAHGQGDMIISNAFLTVLRSPHCGPFQLQIFSYWCDDINLSPFVLNYFRFPSLQAIGKVCSNVENCGDSEVLTSELMDINRTGNISRTIGLVVHELPENFHSVVYHKLKKGGPTTSWPFFFYRRCVCTVRLRLGNRFLSSWSVFTVMVGNEPRTAN